ncbi:protein UBASH3A homolog isoform X2 [Nymphalis io]|uniref:protein UBASH3A homolog isoform X2 n=1 Tax=Inachis io TaxID=171585 RepID=UPI002167F381|nr:protein UBASH3A homolog isoform X2 [Nymphalis io]
MANLPPRKKSASCKISKQDANPLQILLQMGFPKKRALKALAATGNRSVQLASDWLLTHVNDAYIDADEPREFILYAIPTGPLFTQLHDFWEKSKQTGWNGAHNFPPHITLVPSFKAADDISLQLGKAVKQVIETVGKPPVCPIKLEPYISPNFMGLFISEEHEDYLKKISLQYAKQLSAILPNVEAQDKSLHITLAYHFDVNAYDALKALVDKLDLSQMQTPAWELRLYSRDPRFTNHQVYKVTQSYVPEASDELELVLGDYIYIEEKQFDTSLDGWVYGTSWLTGVSGHLPAVCARRTPDSDAWTLHRAISLATGSGGDKSESDSNTDVEMATSYPHEDAEKLALDKSEEVYKTWETYWKAATLNETENILQMTQGSSDKDANNASNEENCDTYVSKNEVKQTHESADTERRWLFALRHGERIDLTYGSWVPYCFDENGTYTRKDLNMPVTLPDRAGGAQSYQRDTPLTRVGELQARLVGEGLRAAGVRLQRVFASAALRCVQTAHHVLQGLQADPSVKIRVEPGLFEFKLWHMTKGLGPFMTPLELHRAGFNVDLDYKPYVELDTNSTETMQEFYERNAYVIQSVAKDKELEGDNIMFVGHATTLDIMVKALKRLKVDKKEFPPYQLCNFLMRVPYCALGAMRDRPLQVTSPPCPPSINSSSGRFDWKLLVDVENEI